MIFRILAEGRLVRLSEPPGGVSLSIRRSILAEYFVDRRIESEAPNLEEPHLENQQLEARSGILGIA
jgi:hypothetical protein